MAGHTPWSQIHHKANVHRAQPHALLDYLKQTPTQHGMDVASGSDYTEVTVMKSKKPSYTSLETQLSESRANGDHWRASYYTQRAELEARNKELEQQLHDRRDQQLLQARQAALQSLATLTEAISNAMRALVDGPSR